MGCQTVHRLLDAYSEGSLRADEQQRVENHLATCPDCRAEVYLAGLLNEIGLDALAPLPPDFTGQVLARADEESSVLWPWLQKRWTVHQYYSATQALAATAAVVAGFSLLLNYEEQTGSLLTISVQVQAIFDLLRGLL